MTAISTSDIVESSIIITAAAGFLTYGVGMKVAGVGVGYLAAATAFLPFLVTPIITASLIVAADYGLITRPNAFLAATLFNSSLVFVGITLGIIFSVPISCIVLLTLSGLAISALLFYPTR